MPSEKSAGFFRPFTEQDASCRRQEWEATFPSLINLLNSTQNQPPVRSITISKLTVRPVRVQRDAYVRGGQPKDYDIKFSVEFEDKSVLRKRRSAADLVREVGRKWGLGAGLEAVIFPSAQWKSAKAVTSSVVFKAKERRAALAGGASAQGGEMTSASTGGELGAGVGPCEDTRARERNRGRESAKEGGIGGEKRKGVVAEKKMRSKRGRNDETKDTGAFGTGGTGGSVAATDTEGAQEVRGRKHTHKRRKTNVAPQIETPIGEMETAIAETPANGGRTAGGTVRSQLAKPGTGISAQGSGSRGAKPYKLRKSTDVLEIRKRPKMAASTPADVGGPNEPPPDEERSPLFEPDRWVPTVRLGKSDAGPVPVGQSAGGSLFGDVIPAAAPVQVGRSGVAGLRDADVSDQGEEWVRQSDISEGAKKGAKVGRSGGATPPSRVGGTGRADRESGGAAMDDSGCAVTDRFRKPGAKKRGLFKWVKSGCDRTEGLKRSARQRQEKPDQPAVAEGGPANGGVFTWVGMGERGTGDNASADQGDVFQGGSGAQVTLGERSERARGVNALSEQGTNLEGASGEEGLLGRGKRKRKPIYDTANVFFWPAPRRQRLAAAADRNEGPASEPAIETSERAPEASERVPVASKRASDVPEPAPDASAKPAPGASEPAFTASGAAPGASAPAPDAPIPAPSVPKTAPNTSEPSPDVSEPAVDASGTDPRASETALEASILLGETAGNEECEQQLAEGERRSGVQNFSESKSPPEKSVGGDGDVPVGVPGDSQAKESAGGATERALEREGTGDATEGVKSPDAQARKEPGRATREKRQRRKECVPKERGPLSGVAMREAKKPGNAKTSVDTECLGGSGDVLQPPGRETEVLARERGSELRRDECKVRAGPTAPLPPSTPSAKKPRARPRNVIILDGSDDEATPTRAPSFGESPNGPTIPFSHPAGAVGSPTPQLPVENDQPDDYNRPNQQRRGGNSEAALSTASSEDGTAPATNLAAATGLWSPAKTPEPSERLQPPLRTPEPSAERPVRRGASPSGPESGHVAGSHVADWHVARADVAETGLFKESLEKGESAPEEAKASDGSNEIGEQAPSGLESVLWGKGSARGDHPGCKKGLAGEPGTAAGRLLNGSQGTAGGAEAGGRQPGKDGEATGQPARVGGSSTSNQLDGEETNRGAGSVSADTGADIVRASARYKSKAPAVTVAGDAPDSLRANAALPSEEQDSGAEERPVTAAGAAEAMEGPDQTRPAVNQSCPESGNEEGEFQGDASGEGRVTAEMKGIDRASVGGCPREVGGLGGEAPKGVGERALGTEEAKAGTGTPFEGAVRSLKAPATELSGRPEPERSAALPEESSKRPPDRIGHPLAPASPREGLPPSWVDKQPEGGVAGPSSELPVLERSERSGRLGLSETPADLSGGRHPSLEPPNMSAGLPGEKENASGKHAEILMGARKAASRGRKLESENSLRASSPLRKAETETRNLGVAVDLQIDALREELEVRTKEVARLKEVEAEWKRWEETLEKDMETSMRKVEEGKAVLAESRKRTAEERAKVEGNFRELMGQWERKKMQMACLEEALMKETERSAESEARQVEAVSEMAEARGKMEAELTSAKTEAASARAEATSVREALRRAERAAADSEVQRLGAARETAQAREAMRKLGEELTSATAEAASARAEVMSARKALRMETERAEAESNARQLEAVRKTGEAQETMEKLEAELTSARAEVTSIEEALRLETERAGDSEAQRLEAVREMAAAREATQKLGVDVTSAKAEAALARAEVTSVRALLEVRAEEYARSQRKSAHLERKRNAALEGTAELERERNAALERTAELEREPNAALERTAELEQERNTALERTAEAEMERDKAIQQNVQLEKRWNDALTRRAQVAGEARMLAEGKARAKKELGSVYAIVEQIEEGLKGEHEKNVSLLGDLRRDANRGVVAPEEKGLGLVVCANAGNVRKDAVRPSHGPSADVATVADVIQDGTQAPGYCVENTGTVSTRISEGGLPRGASRADACIGTEFTVWEGHVTAADVVKRERDVARREKEVLQTELRLPGLLRGLECERESYRRDLECERESYRRDLECERESYRKKVGDLERIVAELQKTYESKCRARRMARS